jgi:hypothetical protein
MRTSFFRTDCFDRGSAAKATCFRAISVLLWRHFTRRVSVRASSRYCTCMRKVSCTCCYNPCPRLQFLVHRLRHPDLWLRYIDVSGLGADPGCYGVVLLSRYQQLCHLHTCEQYLCTSFAFDICVFLIYVTSSVRQTSSLSWPGKHLHVKASQALRLCSFSMLLVVAGSHGA